MSSGVFYRWAFYTPDGPALDEVSQLVDAGKVQYCIVLYCIVLSTLAFGSDLCPEAVHHLEGRFVWQLVSESGAVASVVSDAGSEWPRADGAGGTTSRPPAARPVHFGCGSGDSPELKDFIFKTLNFEKKKRDSLCRTAARVASRGQRETPSCSYRAKLGRGESDWSARSASGDT